MYLFAVVVRNLQKKEKHKNWRQKKKLFCNFSIKIKKNVAVTFLLFFLERKQFAVGQNV